MISNPRNLFYFAKYILLLLAVFISGIDQVYAAARSTPFTPGQTLDPGTDSEPCGPLDANCFPSATASTSPTVGYITATSTTATSTFAGGLSVAGASGLTVLQNGNVGIGTSSPLATLNVVGNTILNGNTYANIDGGRQFLRDFDAQIAKMSQGTAQASVAFIGDSYTTSQSYTAPIISYLQNIYGFAGAGYIGIQNSMPVPAGLTRTQYGTWTHGQYTYGPSLSFLTSSDTTASTTFTGRATQLVIQYLNIPGGGTFSYAVNGLATTTINTNNAVTSTQTVTIGSLSATVIHSLAIWVTTAGTVGNTIYGVDFQSNSSSGIRFHNLGFTGTTATSWTNINSTIWQDSMTALAPNLVVIMLGVNDEAGNIAPTTYAANMSTLINRVKTALPNASIMLMTPGDISNIYAYPMSDYVDQMAKLSADNDLAFLNNYVLIGDYATANTRGLFTNTTHLNASGYNLLSNHFVSFILQSRLISTPSLVSTSLIGGGSPNYSLFSTNFPSLTSGINNLAIGYLTLNAVTTGVNNIALGLGTAQAVTTASGITAIGKGSMILTTTGGSNTAIGESTLARNIAHVYNAAFGNLALTNATANYNTALGVFASKTLTTGQGNVTVGYNAGESGTAANAALTDDYTVYIGYQAGRSVLSATKLSNSIAIGKNALVGISNAMVLGGTGADAVSIGIGTSSPMSKLSIFQSANSVAGGISISSLASSTRSIFMDDSSILHFTGAGNDATLNSSGAWTNASDASYKENIVDLSTKYGLNTVLSTTPRYYEMKNSHITQVGFIAQELKLIIPEVVEGTDGNMGISYGNLVAVAFQAIKELSIKVDNLITNNILNVKSLFVDNIKSKNIESEKLCLGTTCVTEEELKSLLSRENIIPSAYTPPPVSTSTETIVTTTDTVATTTPVVIPQDVASTTTEVIAPEPTPTEVPYTTQIPEPTTPSETPTPTPSPEPVVEAPVVTENQ